MDLEQIKKAALILDNDGVVGMPTETVYGLAARIDKEKALKKVFSIKKRPFFDPLIVHIADLKQKDMVVSEWPQLASLLAQNFWPGPLTFVLKKQKTIHPLITSGLETVGIRYPSHPVAQKLIEVVGVPLAAPSANKFKKTSPTRLEHVKKSFPDLMVLDGGESEVGIESSVIEIKQESINILRPGAITYEMLESVLKSSGLDYKLDYRQSSIAPGHLQEHYRPSKPLVVFLSKNSQHNISKDLLSKSLESIGYGSKIGVELQLPKDPQLMARYLYHELRIASERDGDYIYIIYSQAWQGQLWKALWDRIHKAATHILPL